jgi:DNA-binding response OmpR family regulator
MQLIEQIFTHRPSIRLLAVEEGEVGLKVAQEENLHLILLDLNLPDMSGYEILHKLKASSKTQNIPVVIVSADATAGQIKRLLESGAYTYLTKPIEVTNFLQVVDEILNKA